MTNSQRVMNEYREWQRALFLPCPPPIILTKRVRSYEPYQKRALRLEEKRWLEEQLMNADEDIA